MPGLKKAATGGHLAEVLAAERDAPAKSDVIELDPTPAVETSKAAAAPKPSQPVRTAKAPSARTAPVPAEEKAGDERPAYKRPDHSGTVSLGWKFPPEDALALRAAVRGRYDDYADAMTERTGQDGWRLSVSGVIIGAWTYAAPHVDEWLPSCPGDGRATKVSTADYLRVQASLPKELERLLQRTVRLKGLDFEAAGGKGLTLVGLILGALRFSLPHIDEWLTECPNDGRRVKPTSADGRRKQNR